MLYPSSFLVSETRTAALSLYMDSILTTLGSEKRNRCDIYFFAYFSNNMLVNIWADVCTQNKNQAIQQSHTCSFSIRIRRILCSHNFSSTLSLPWNACSVGHSKRAESNSMTLAGRNTCRRSYLVRLFSDKSRANALFGLFGSRGPFSSRGDWPRWTEN